MTENLPLPALLLGAQPSWEMPELPSLHKLPAHATFWPFPGPDAALARHPEASPMVRCLNGGWDFQLFERPGDVTPAALAAGSWRRLAVPGNWTMQLRTEPAPGRAFTKPHYTNNDMPFPELFPHVPEFTATGVYRTTFSVPAEWSGQRIVLHFAGCESALYVYLNGEFIGMNKDSRTPAEYDITNRVEAGKDYELMGVNPRFSDASFLEDQDHWWQAGIHRDVYLYTTPRIFLEDLAVQSDLAADFSSATLRIKAVVRSLDTDPMTGEVTAQLYNAAGQPVFKGPLEIGLPEDLTGKVVPYRYATPADTAPLTLSATVAQPRLWSAETPYLYTLVVTLETAHGTESTAIRIGFRKVTTGNRELLVNGQPVMIHGMNRHDHSDTAGKAVTRELMELDARTMKAHNVNAVRTSHYPNDPYWLELCDEYGFYVIDEANIENHAWFGLSEDKRVSAAYLERVRNMVERDKNHVCVIAWSLGNESGHGINHDAAGAWVRHYDPSRVLHYEGGVRQLYGGARDSNWGSGHAVTDIICPMYPQIAEIVRWVTTSNDPRPLIMCEYAHAMGNSTGSLSDYYAAFETYHGLQGGFIWEWLDHGIRMETPEGAPYWVYGGDFGDEPNDSNFVADGMVWPDRTPHPGLNEFKYLARPVRVTALDAAQGLVQIENRRYFADLSDLRGEWVLKVAGKVVQSGELSGLNVPPMGKVTRTIPVQWPGAAEAFLEFRFTTLAATPWAPAGILLAWDQLAGPAPVAAHPAGSSAGTGQVEVTEEAGQLSLSLAGQQVTFDSALGELVSLGSPNLLVGGPVLNLWRAPTDNDTLQLRMKSYNRAVILWKALGLEQLHRRLVSFQVNKSEEGRPVVEIRHVFSGREQWNDVQYAHTYTMLADGSVSISNRVKLAADFGDLPRVGLNLRLNPELENLTWYGRGPLDSYSDRKAGTMVDVYSSTVTEQYVPFIMPQENGHKTDVRRLRLTGAAGQGLEVTADGLFEFNALHFTDADLTAARHTPDLKPRPEVVLNLDHGMRGLGTGLVVDTLPEYQLNSLEYSFTFNLKPV
jgi:beta-galactosidase